MNYLDQGNIMTLNGSRSKLRLLRPMRVSIIRYCVCLAIPAQLSVDIDVRDPDPGESLLLIHHPGGLPKQVTRGNCRAASPDAVVEHEVLHKCDTLGGSSGSPVFSDSDGRMIVLHHAGSRNIQVDTYNYAVRIKEIAPSGMFASILGGASPAAPSSGTITAVVTPTVVSSGERNVTELDRLVPPTDRGEWDVRVIGCRIEASLKKNVETYLARLGFTDMREGTVENNRLTWFAPSSSIFWYSESALPALKAIRDQLHSPFGVNFALRHGAGSGLANDRKTKTLFIHIIGEGC